MQYWKGNPQGRKLFDNLIGQEGMSVEELCNIASDLHSKCEELESVLEVYEDCLGKLEDENKELKEENEKLICKLTGEVVRLKLEPQLKQNKKSIKDAVEVNNLLKKQEETIRELNKYCTACDDTLLTIQELTYKLLTIDFENVESKADYCRLLNELDNKDLSFIHDCIKAINKCDLMKMEELKREYGDIE